MVIQFMVIQFMAQHTTQFLLQLAQWFKMNKELQEEEEMMSTLFLTEDEYLNESFIEIDKCLLNLTLIVNQLKLPHFSFNLCLNYSF